MAITVYKSDGDLLTTIPDGKTDDTTTSLFLIGDNTLKYGQNLDQDFVYLLQNFSSGEPPTNPLTGQMWHDTGSNSLRVFDGVRWAVVSPGFDGNAGMESMRQLGVKDYLPGGLGLFSYRFPVGMITYAGAPIDFMPGNVHINGITYDFKASFPDGVQPGYNLFQTSNVGGIYYGMVDAVDVLAKGSNISLVGAVGGSNVFDGSSNINVEAVFNNVYVGNTNVTISGTYNNVTVSDGGQIIGAGPISNVIIIGALGYNPFTADDVSPYNLSNLVISRDQNGSFSSNIMFGTASNVVSMSNTVVMAIDGDVIGGNSFNGTSNVVIVNSLSQVPTVSPGVYNNVTVNSSGRVVSGVLTSNLPVGSMVLYNNLIVPDGWLRCNGSNIKTPDGTTVTTPNLSNVIVGGSYYIMKTSRTIDLPDNDSIIGSISINLVKGGAPSVLFIGGPNITYPPLRYGNINVSATGNTVIGKNHVTVADYSIRSPGSNYIPGDRLYIDLPTFDQKKSEAACIEVETTWAGNGAIRTSTLVSGGKYVPNKQSGYDGVQNKKGNDRQNKNPDTTPIGNYDQQTYWPGIPGLLGNKVKGRREHDQDGNSIATVDVYLVAKEPTKFVVDDIDLSYSVYFDAVSICLANGDTNAVMLSQTDLFGDLSNLTIIQVIENLQNRKLLGLPPRCGKYMLHVDDIINQVGLLGYPVDITYFTVSVQNRIMVSLTVDHATRMSNAGIYPSDDKLFGAMYVGLDRFMSIYRAPRTALVGDTIEAAGYSRTSLPMYMDALTNGEFLTYLGKMIVNAKVAVSNYRITYNLAVSVNKWLGKTVVAIPDPLVSQPLLTTGNANIIVSGTTIDSLPALYGGGNPNTANVSYGGGAFVNVSAEDNQQVYTYLSSVRYGNSFVGGGGGAGGGGSTFVPNPSLTTGNGVRPADPDTVTGSNPGLYTPGDVPADVYTDSDTTYTVSSGFFNSLVLSESTNNPNIVGTDPPHTADLTAMSFNEAQQYSAKYNGVGVGIGQISRIGFEQLKQIGYFEKAGIDPDAPGSFNPKNQLDASYALVKDAANQLSARDITPNDALVAGAYKLGAGTVEKCLANPALPLATAAGPVITSGNKYVTKLSCSSWISGLENQFGTGTNYQTTPAFSENVTDSASGETVNNVTLLGAITNDPFGTSYMDQVSYQMRVDLNEAASTTTVPPADIQDQAAAEAVQQGVAGLIAASTTAAQAITTNVNLVRDPNFNQALDSLVDAMAAEDAVASKVRSITLEQPVAKQIQDRIIGSTEIDTDYNGQQGVTVYKTNGQITMVSITQSGVNADGQVVTRTVYTDYNPSTGSTGRILATEQNGVVVVGTQPTLYQSPSGGTDPRATPSPTGSPAININNQTSGGRYNPSQPTTSGGGGSPGGGSPGGGGSSVSSPSGSPMGASLGSFSGGGGSPGGGSPGGSVGGNPSPGGGSNNWGGSGTQARDTPASSPSPSSPSSSPTSFSGCFAQGTLFKMADGSLKPIEDIRIGDEMLVGGRVTLVFVGDGKAENWFDYKDIRVTGTHPVFDHDGVWRRVGDTKAALPIESQDLYYSLHNEKQRMIAWNDIVFTDFLEVGFDNPMRKTLYGITTSNLIRMLNGEPTADI